MEIFVMSAAGIYDWPIIKQVSWLLGQVMNGIYNALYKVLEKQENYGVRIEHRDIEKDTITKRK